MLSCLVKNQQISTWQISTEHYYSLLQILKHKADAQWKFNGEIMVLMHK